MILYLLLEAILFILNVVANLFGTFIPNFPSVLSEILNTISTMVNGGLSFLSYFFYVPVVVALINLVITWHSFKLIKDAVMKVIGHFIAN